MLGAAEAGQEVTVDLDAQVIRLGAENEPIAFDVDPHRKRSLLLGLDEIGAILTDDAEDIARFETRHRARSPWLHLDGDVRAFLRDPEAGVVS